MKRRCFGYRPDPANLQTTLAHLALMREVFAENAAAGTGSTPFRRATVLEIGSGWFPLIPLVLCADGADRVYMSDLVPYQDDVTVQATLHFLRRTFPERREFAEFRGLDTLPIDYLAPFDAARVPDGSVDLVISRTVLEHIPPDQLVALFRRLRPKLKPDGRMLHLIDHSDHLEFADKSISRIHFLTWSRRRHRLINALMKEGENRLRHHEYPPLFENAGYRVVDTRTRAHDETLRVLRDGALPLAPPYTSMPPEQLAILTSVYLLAPTPGPPP